MVLESGRAGHRTLPCSVQLVLTSSTEQPVDWCLKPQQQVDSLYSACVLLHFRTLLGREVHGVTLFLMDGVTPSTPHSSQVLKCN